MDEAVVKLRLLLSRSFHKPVSACTPNKVREAPSSWLSDLCAYINQRRTASVVFRDGVHLAARPAFGASRVIRTLNVADCRSLRTLRHFLPLLRSQLSLESSKRRSNMSRCLPFTWTFENEFQKTPFANTFARVASACRHMVVTTLSKEVCPHVRCDTTCAYWW